MAPHGIEEERISSPLNYASFPFRHLSAHDCMQATSANDAVFERIHVEVANYKGSAMPYETFLLCDGSH